MPQIYSGQVVYFADQEKSKDSFISKLWQPDAWNRWVINGVEVYEIPGDHLSMTKEPNVHVLAEKLSTCLDRAECEEKKIEINGEQLSSKLSMNQELEEKGYTVINLLNEDEVQNLFDLYMINSLSNDSLGYYSFTNSSSDLSHRQLLIQEIKTIFEPKLIKLFPNYTMIASLFVSKKPGSSSSEMLLHQDPSVVDETYLKSFQIWCPLIDVDENNGCLQVINKSHVLTSKPRHQFAFNIFPYSKDILSCMKHRYLTSAPMRAGQALIFYDRRLFHGSYPNLSDAERVAIVCILAPKNKPIHFCYLDSPESKKMEIFAIDDSFYDSYIPGEKLKGVESLSIIDYEVDSLTVEQLIEFMNAPKLNKNEEAGIKDKFFSLFNLLRGNDWWFYKIPPLLAIAYAEILIQDAPPQQSIITLMALLVSMFFVAAYGHVVNDIFDIEVDLKAGKQNRMAPLSRGQRILLSLGLAIAGAVPWLFIGFNSASAILLASIYTLLTIYPAPPLRLKERYIWGAVADAATVHAIPTLLIATVFSSLMATPQSGNYSLAIIATAWAFGVGVRGILLHQIWDRENDLKSGVKTLATKFGVASLRIWINYIVFPLEAILSGRLVLLISQSVPLLLVPFTVYLLLLFFSTAYDNFDPSPSEKSYVVLHDFYEVWLPLGLLTLLSFRQPVFLIILVLHTILFYSAIKQRLLVLARSLVLKLEKIINLNAYTPENLETNTDQVPKNQAQNTQKTFLELPSSELEISIVKAIDFLKENQLEDGELATYEDSYNFDSSPFITSLILYSLSFLAHENYENKGKTIIDKGVKFLVQEMELRGLWRYWSSKNDRHTMIPPDLDDICCISYILKMNNIPVPNNTDIILDNRNKEGIFYTWILPRSIRSITLNFITFGKALSHSKKLWQLTEKDDICCVVNANVLLYLGETPQTQKSLEYLIDVVRAGNEEECSAFYSNKLSFYYMLSRAYFNGVTSLGVVKIPIVTKILNLQQTDGSFGDELLTALAICTLLNFNHVVPSLEKAIKFLLDTQQFDGSWQRLPMYGGKLDKHFFGSAALTTGFCVEALVRYRLQDIFGYRQQEEVKIQEVQAQLRADLEMQLQQTKQELTQSQSQLHTSQTELTQFQSQLKATQTELVQSQSQLHTSQTELTHSQSELQISQRELAQLKSYLQQTQGVEGLISYYHFYIASNPDDIQLYHQALEVKPDDAQTHLQLGNALVRQNRFSEAIATYKTALQFHPNNFEIHLELGKVLEKEQKWEQAIAAYRRAIELNPDDGRSHKHLGDILAECGQINEASVSYRRALQLQPRIF